MRRLLAPLAIALLGTYLGACGGTSTSIQSATHVPARHTPSTTTATSNSTTSSTTDYAKVDADKDNDLNNPNDDTSNREALAFGHAAGAADRHTITALVKRYYATALAGNGASACSMLYSTISESAAEDYGLVPGPIYLRGAKTCREVMTRLFSHSHARLAVEVPKLAVTHVLLKERHGLVLLSFANLPEREIQVAREGHVWKIAALIDGELP